ncbi:hypothetical protein FRB90_009500 [Tulasnella sp. 427]|nr:hypothetical protein FRB90_009500 [Tulasnella sp. 427]
MHSQSLLSLFVKLFTLPHSIFTGSNPRPAIPILSSDTWAQFNSTLSGRLHLSTTESGPCAVNAALLQGLTFEASGEKLTPWEQCQVIAAKGGNNGYYVDAHTTADVVNAFRFVDQTGVPLVLNNLETEFCSSPSPNTLTILTESMNKLDFIRSFQPRQCSSIQSTPAISFSSGASLKSIYSLAEREHVTVVGPTAINFDSARGDSFFKDTTSVLAPALGSALDNLLEVEIVTPDGQGGGVNNFALVTRITVKAHPQTPLTVYSLALASSQSNTRRVISALAQHALEMAKNGWGGYVSASGVLLVNPTFGGNLDTAKQSIGGLVKDMTVDGKEEWARFADFGEWISSEDYETVHAFVKPLQIPNQAISSRLITTSLFKDVYGKQDLVKAISTPTQRVDSWLVALTLPYAHSGSTTSFTPALYDSPWNVYFLSSLEPGMSKEDRLIKLSAVAKANNFLRYLTPGSGVYSEQADLSEPNHEGPCGSARSRRNNTH